MAVAAANLAFVDLGRDRWPRETATKHLGDLFTLAPHVIELKYDGVRLAAVHTRVLA
jgi:hypothetical protein